MGKSIRPVHAQDLIGQSGDPVTMQLFKSANIAAETENIPKSDEQRFEFDPHTPELEYIPNATPFTTNIDYFNNLRQPALTKLWRSSKQFGANLVSSVGQGLANTFDLVSLANTAAGEFTGGQDDFNSKLFGLSTKKIKDWANGVAERNKIFEENPDSFDPSNLGWWAKQFASSGTGVGMAIEALGTTAAIEFATGGTGTGAALAKLGNLIKRTKNVNDALEVAKGLKSAATLYGVINRYSESRMEANQSYETIYNELSQQKNSDGTDKFSEEEKTYLASSGARKTFNYNLALLPLDILAFRTMVFNPISGSGVGLLEKGLGKVAGIYGKSKLGKLAGLATTQTIGAGLEGTEEGFQFIGSNEGEHYARVLAGMDDGSTFAQRLGAGVQSDEFWNNFAGGVIGTPIISGAMNLVNKAIQGKRANRINDIYKDYIQNVGKMDSAIANKIRTLEANGDIKTAQADRRQFGANKALSALHLDAMTDKETAFDSYRTFLEGTLSDVSANKLDVLQDLGFNNPTPEQVQQIQSEFQSYIADADMMKNIYEDVAAKYNKNFVPQITTDHFQLNKLLEERATIENPITSSRKKITQYEDLSSQGKTLFDVDYRLEALQLERARLTNLYKNTQNPQEKENVQQLLDSNTTKLQELKEQVETINKDEEYKDSEKNRDAEIIRSSLRQSDYIYAIYDKERLDNDISAKRKKIALWDNPEYLAQLNKEAVSKAKTITQVEETEKDIVAKKQDTEEVKEAIQQKKDEIAAEAATTIIKQQEESKERDTFDGDGNLFGEDNGFIDAIKEDVQNIPKKEGYVKENAEPEYLLAPATYDFNKSPEEAKNRVINGVRGLLDRLAGNTSFEDLVRHVIKVQGEAVADDIYNAIKFGWEGNGMPKQDYEAIYNKIFGNPIDELLKGAAEFVKEQAKQEKKIIEQQNEPDGFDENNQPTYTYKGIVTNESSPKLAFKTRLSEQVVEKDDKGNVIVDNEYTESELNQGDYTDGLPLLDPDKYGEGTELTIRIPANYLDIKIPVYNTDGTKGKAVTFGEYVTTNNLKPSDREYQDKIPMIIYDNPNGKGLAFVHDIGWYHPLRFNQEFKEDMDAAIASTRDIRDAVLTSTNNSTPIIITGKRQTTFAGLKTEKDKLITLKEATGDTELTVAKDSSTLNTSKKNIAFPNNKTKLMGQGQFKKGGVYDVRRYGTEVTEDGTKIETYQAFVVTTPLLDRQAKLSVYKAIEIYANRSVAKTPELKAKHDAIVATIKSSMGLDILDSEGLEQYLKHFINIDNRAKDNATVESRAKAEKKAGTPYISFISGGNIVFGRAGEAAFVSSATGKPTQSFYVNPNATASPKIALDNLAKEKILGWYEFNVDLDALSTNKPVVTIDESFNPSINENYKDFLKAKLKTNIKSANIGTQESPKWVTNIQPVITYELKSKLDGQQIKQKEQETLEKAPEITNTENKSKEDLLKEYNERAKKNLGNNRGIGKNRDLLAPRVLTETERKQIGNSILRVAGLTPDQQGTVVNFMFNQIIGSVGYEQGNIPRSQIDKEIKQAFDKYLKPTKEKYKEEIKFIKDLIKQFPDQAQSQAADDVLDYEYMLDKIAAIEDNFNTLKQLAYNEVEKYTNITQDTVKVDNELTGVQGEIDNESQQDFWTDVLRESPEDKISYALRRFFGQIKESKKNGDIATGFLNLPLYVGSDTVIKTLIPLLANVPSDFGTMIAKLKEHKNSISWLNEVIDRLEGASKQTKAQFVTVMTNTPLKAKFTMISYNRRNKTWSTKLYDTTLNGVADSIKASWVSGFTDSNLVLYNTEGDYYLNKPKAEVLRSTFSAWTGKSLKIVTLDPNEYWESVVSKVKADTTITFNPTGELLRELNTNVVKAADRVKFSMKSKEYQITKSDGKFKISQLKQELPTTENVEKWLKEFGITLSPEAMKELMTKGMYHNYAQRTPYDLFYSDNGLFNILNKSLGTMLSKEGDHYFNEYGDSPIDNSVINSLANLDSKHNNQSTPFGFRDNGKSFFAFTAPKFITDRSRDLKLKDSPVLNQLQSISFSSPSLWLTLLNDETFKTKFEVSHLGDTAFKQQGKRLYKDNSLPKLADLDHELAKLGMFWDTSKGSVEYSNSEGTYKTYPGTSIPMRLATVFSPTMSDKHIMTIVTTAMLDLRNSDLPEGNMTDDVTKVLYEQLVKPELQRMIKFHQNQQNGIPNNIDGYAKGAGMFMMLPELNNIEYTQGLRLIDFIKQKPFDVTTQFVEGNKDLMAAISSNIKTYVTQLVNEKLDIWNKLGITGNDAKNNMTLKFFDKKYLDRLRGTNKEKATMAAQDFVINSLIANANSFMVFAGDPALYYKSKAQATNYLQQCRDTFINIGKRLANMIAPGITLSNSEHEKYIQVFLADRKSLPEIPFLKYVTKINDGEEITDNEVAELQAYYKDIFNNDRPSTSNKAAFDRIVEKYPKSRGYLAIEGSDAQEYTTWKEHLDIIAKLGKTPDSTLDITPEEIHEARELFSSDITKDTLSEKQQKLIAKVMQPIKPVYTGQLFDPTQDVMRTMYIKSSSFPLIPQLTAGMEIDKLRVAMEALEAKTKQNVRASYGTANKVGAITNPVKIWNDEGRIVEDNLKQLDNSILILDRKNFRIQQEVPFKSSKVEQDTITLGTQIMKLLFGDGMLDKKGFKLGDSTMTGQELYNTYNETFYNLINEKKHQLYEELGMDSAGNPIDYVKTMAKIQEVLKKEAVKRGYPLQSINSLQLTPEGDFNLPLWASTDSNRYESMLNSIITNRMIRIKFPGASYVVGSEEGFKRQENLEGVDKSKIIYTKAWNGSELQASYKKDGKLNKAQVLLPSKFRGINGELIDLFSKKDGKYIYITEKQEGGYSLNEEKFDEELLSNFSFRLPTSGHKSASIIEIAGFLPFENGDLMIVPRNFTKQKGLDFDIDKEYAYQLWTHFNPTSGKLEVLQEKHRTEILASADTEMNKLLADDSAAAELMKHLFGEELPDYTEEEIKSKKALNRLNSTINEKLNQNKIINIHRAVFLNPDDEIQSKINSTLNTDFVEEQAALIENISFEGKGQYWTPLSDEYQKQKLISGSSGKLGTGAYSLDLVFHSLAEQAAATGKPVTLVETVKIGDEEVVQPISWRFGNRKTDGVLGRSSTLDEGRSVTEVVSERQNMAVDNEKLQVMGVVNINDLTLDVDKVFTLLGFDKGNDGNSISMLFLSQPIIKKYIERMRNASSIMADFDLDKEGTVVRDLLTEYDPNTQEINDDYWATVEPLMTNENFKISIQAQEPLGKLQGAVLRRFIQMKEYGIAIRGIQVAINTDSRGLGKSFFDVIEKRNALNRLGVDSSLIIGASNIIGDYQNKPELGTEEYNNLLKEGYEDIGNWMVKPNTVSGAFNILGVNTAYNLWGNLFPYDTSVMNAAFKEIIPIITTGERANLVELKQEIFQEFKKYSSASLSSGLIEGNISQNDERARLYIDTDTNTSLAKYLKALKDREGNPVVDAYIKTNKLINRFEYKIEKNGQPSLIKFNNAKGEEFDEQYLYESLSSLLEAKKSGSIPLPKIGNKEYTLDTLAQDLIAYSYLGNAIQEAIQFTKYTPVEYLNISGYSNRMRMANTWFKDNVNLIGKKIGKPVDDKASNLVSEFTMQFIQHNPERVKPTKEAFKSEIVEIDKNTFTITGPIKPIFIKEYDSNIPKGEKKVKLYWFDGEKYTRIPVLGTFGMDEYQPRNDIGTSLVNVSSKLKINPQGQIGTKAPETKAESTFNLASGNIQDILKSIVDANTTTYSELAKYLMSFAGNVRIEGINEFIWEGQDIAHTFNGLYDKIAQKIYINNVITNRPNLTASTILHELVHHITIQEIDKFIEDGYTINPQLKTNAPAYVSNLIRVYNRLLDKIGRDKIGAINKKVRNKEMLSEEEGKLYPYIDIYEFISGALTNSDFQKQLNSIPYDSKQSILDRFKAIIADILKAVGVTFDTKYTAAHAISDIFQLIDNSKANTQEVEFNPYQTFYDDSINDDYNFLDELYSESVIEFEEEQSTGYRERTIKNASADATIAIAADFMSAGEKLTKSTVLAQKKQYIPIHIFNPEDIIIKEDVVEKIVKELNAVNAKTLNIAGNGIYTFAGRFTQTQLDGYVQALLDAVMKHPDLKNKIVSIRSGGQTGIDEAGAKAGIKLGIPTKVLAPKGWKFRNIKGVDIANERQFKDRFGSERDYINLSVGPKSMDEIYAFPSIEGIGVYKKYLEFKKSQLRDLRDNLNKVKAAINKKDVTTEQLTKLKNRERELELEIKGNFELKKKGLVQEIAELQKDVSTNALGYYIEKDISRIQKLVQSDDLSDLQEAQRLIDFYRLVGQFRRGVENPFFAQTDIFLEDENENLTEHFKLPEEVMAQFKEWSDRAVVNQNILDKKLVEAAVNAVNNDPSVKRTYGDKSFTFGEITNSVTGLKDADWLSMWTMDITQGVFSHNGLIPQVMFSRLANASEEQLSWARKVEEEIDKINPKVIDELKKINQTYKDQGIIGINGSSYQIFKEVTKDGNETGGLIQRFNKEYFDIVGDMQNDFSQAFSKSLVEGNYTNATRLRNKAFEKLKGFRRINTQIIDISKLDDIINDSEFKSIVGNSKADDTHKQELIALLGQKGYKEQIELQKKRLRKYLSERESIITTINTAEGTTTLSDKGKSELSYWEFNHNPMRGLEDFYSVRGIFFGDRKGNNFMDYNVFVPRKFKAAANSDGNTYTFKDSPQATGFYNDTFKIIEENEVLSNFHDTVKETLEKIREVMPWEIQNKMAANTIPALIKSSAEIINDKNTGILQSIIPFFRDLIEKIRVSFGTIKQSEISYATIDPITGKANYKVNDEFMRGNTRAVSERMKIEKIKFLQAFNTGKQDDEKADSINRYSVFGLSRFTPSSLVLLSEYLNIDISLADIQAGRLDKIRDRIGNNVPIGRIIRDYSLHQVVQSQSFDLAKIMKYYANMSAAYAARQEALPILEIMKQHYEKIQKPKTTNLGAGIYNANDEQYMKEGVRTNSIKQMDDWFERVALGNYNTKHLGPHGNKKDLKRQSKIVNEMLAIDKQLENMPSGAEKDKLIAKRERLSLQKNIPSIYGSDIYTREEKKKIVEIENLLANEEDDDKRKALIKIREGLGRARTATAAIDNIWAWIRTMRLGYNLSSATTNFMEGVTSNLIMASTGEYFDPKEIYFGYSVAKASFIKNITFGAWEQGSSKKNRLLMDKFNVIMDSKNELQKSSIKTRGSKAQWLAPHELNQRVEFINQSPVMIAMLRTQKIKDKSGKEDTIWNAYNTNGHLKDEFRTEENIKNWEDLSGDDYLNFKQKLHKAIVLGHGNYDDLRGMMLKSSSAGKGLAMFKTWLPMQFYWRFATEQDDIQSGTQGFKGRYWSYGKGTGAVHGAVIGAALLGPVGIPLFGGAGAILGGLFGKESGASFMKETIEATKDLSKKVLGFPINLLRGRKIINTDGSSFEGKEFDKLTPQDVKNLKANMADITLQLAWIAMMLIVKSIFWDDDDEPDDPERVAHNILINKLMNLSSQGAQYVNPVDTYKSVVGDNAVAKYLEDVGKFFIKVERYFEGRDIIPTGINAGESGLANQFSKTFIPGIFKDGNPVTPLLKGEVPSMGFKSQSERVFEESPWHPFFKSDAKLDKEENARDRAERRNQLESQGVDKKEIRQILDEEFPTPSRLKKLGVTREEYEKSQETSQ